MCSNHNHKLISDIHSTLEIEFHGARMRVPDTDEVSECRRILGDNPDSAEALLRLGDALAFQMRYREALIYYEKAAAVAPDNYEARRKCAVRYMSTMQIDKAEREFLWCRGRAEDMLDIEYRLALCDYYKGDFLKAREGFLECYPLAVGNDEMYIAVIYWHILCQVKLGEGVMPALAHFSEGLDAGHHIGYMQTARLFAGGDPKSARVGVEGHGELAESIYLYGLYHYYIYNKDNAAAEKALKEMLELNTYFSSFAYLGAFSEIMRKKGIR